MDDRRARAEAIEDFAEVLRELRKSVGDPSFREMSGRSGAISHTTLHEATKGNRLPSWETTVEFVKVCGADPDTYRERWEKANRTVRSAGAGLPAARADAPTARADAPTARADAPADRADAPADPPSEGPAASAAGAAEAHAAERHTVHLALSAQAPRPNGETLVSAPPPPVEAADDVQPAPAPGRRRRFRLARPVVAALAVKAVGAGAVAGIIADRGTGPDERDPAGGPSTAALTPGDCPVRPTNPAAAPPAHEGDAAAFLGDVTLPDCTRVGTGATVTKAWRLKNVGTVPWKGYSLRLLDFPQQADQCQTISHVPIENTPPGEAVEVRVEVTTPRKPGFCYVRFKMVDASGGIAFPGNRPINFQIIVAER
ncbi:NBR1-Ig-like domain-containing protein [Actinocorallia libanotica]|uniref:Nbr1 FW domain-containing protein n=1 Tax=Actinocorallia libanotica TaxID=46162 RepID=A0ABP4CA88_9ACTN